MNWIVSIFLPLSCAAEECLAPLGKRSGKNTERRIWLLLPGPVTSSVVWHFVCHSLSKVVHLLQLCVSHQAAVHRDAVKKSDENLEPLLRAPCIAVPPPPSPWNFSSPFSSASLQNAMSREAGHLSLSALVLLSQSFVPTQLATSEAHFTRNYR